MHHKFVVFPFSAIVGQETMKNALLINAVDPSIGGVLVKGDKGTGKSTAVRALADSLPRIRIVRDCPFNCHPENLRLMCKACQERAESGETLPFTERKMEIVDMPLSSTEDMVVGSIDIKRALREGMKALEPGIMARANRNILYIDEVNLLDDHLVNILLDAAAMGVNIVEREGISLYHPARFILVGTMNPEEGELRPQILDRFGLCVSVEALAAKEERLEVLGRRRDFDADAWRFEEAWKELQTSLRSRIAAAQDLAAAVAMPEAMLGLIVDITTSLGIRTHRADIVMEKSARALAALAGRREVTDDDVKEAALLALCHRMKQAPFEKGRTLTRETIESLLADPGKDEVVDLDRNLGLKKNFLKADTSAGSGRDAASVESDRGRYVKARDSRRPRSVAVDATLRRTVRETGRLEVLPEHLMEKVRIGRGRALYIILLDSSSSMRLDRKIRFAKTLAWLLLKQSYEKRSRVALLALSGGEVRVLAPPTRDAGRIEEALEQLPTGGKTPLTPALFEAFKMSRKEKESSATIIVISDGKGNVFLRGGMEEDMRWLTGERGRASVVMVNAEMPARSIGVLEEMARLFDAPHFYLEAMV